MTVVQWRGERYDGTSTRTGPLQSKKIINRIEKYLILKIFYIIRG